jgi:Na+/H+ antiporter NhaD/arsenite permease-like protein
MLFLASVHSAVDIPPVLILPFAFLLLLIATAPLGGPKFKHWWEHNFLYVSLGLAAIVAIYYVARVPEGSSQLGHTASEYFSFITLIGSLFVVAGGIHLKVKGEAGPLTNVAFLLVGAALANLIGTTGASMVLIRPYIRMNKIRISGFHIVFFIFLVSNVGGSLTPIGDPPLFLGFLRGIPFFWLTEHVLLSWFITVGLLLGAFYAFDLRSYRHAPKRIQQEIDATPETFRFDGYINVLFLAVIIGAVFMPERFFLREAVMLAAAIASYFLTGKQIHEENHFSFGPVKEVAYLFVGIFITMMPALGYLEQHGKEFGLTKPAHYYFATGSLSAVLDNAPTYVNFLKLAEVSARADHPDEFREAEATGSEEATIAVLLAKQPALVVAVSLGAVFFGAMTYIGNGPNFMVKSIAESAGVHVPTFFDYIIKYSLPILLPILALVGWIFL